MPGYLRFTPRPDSPPPLIEINVSARYTILLSCPNGIFAPPYAGGKKEAWMIGNLTDEAVQVISRDVSRMLAVYFFSV